MSGFWEVYGLGYGLVSLVCDFELGNGLILLYIMGLVAFDIWFSVCG